MTDDNKPTIENPLKTGLRQQAGLGLSKECLKLRDYASSPNIENPLKNGLSFIFGQPVFFN